MELILDKNFRGSIPKDKLRLVNDIVVQLDESLRDNSFLTFGSSKNVKAMKGVKGIFKFEADGGDRIVFGFSGTFPRVKEEYPNSIVLLRYTNHDLQGKTAEKINKLTVWGEKTNT